MKKTILILALSLFSFNAFATCELYPFCDIKKEKISNDQSLEPCETYPFCGIEK